MHFEEKYILWKLIISPYEHQRSITVVIVSYMHSLFYMLIYKISAKPLTPKYNQSYKLKKIVTKFICLPTFNIARCDNGAPTPETTFSTD